MRTWAVVCLLGAVTTGASAQEAAQLDGLTIKDNVKWIEETPQNPEEYIGRIFVVKKGVVTPHYQSLALPTETTDAPSIKKSVLITAKADASVSFADIVSIKATSDSVYEFQNVNTRVWSAKSKEASYLKAITQFRNDPTFAPLFSSADVDAVLMCVGVVQKKIWYRTYSKQGYFGGGTYFVKVGGSTYSGSEEYEEVVKYGLLVRPISGYGITLPATVANTEEVKRIINNPAAITEATRVVHDAAVGF